MRNPKWEDCDCDNGWIPDKRGPRGGRYQCPKCGGQGSVLVDTRKKSKKQQEEEAYEQQ